MTTILDGVELPQVQRIASEDEEVLAQHGVPALEGDFLQSLGRRAVRVTLTGVLTGPEAGEGLKELREKFHAAAPVSFVSDIGTATKVDKVLIEEMGVRELAGKTERFEYALSLREYTPPPAATEEPPPVIPPPPVPVTATLVAEVIVEGEPGFDPGGMTVTATGTREDGTPFSTTLSAGGAGGTPFSRMLSSGGSWTREDMPPGHYTVQATTAGSPELVGSAPVTVLAGQTVPVTVTLRPGTIARAFVVHFGFNSSFVEPCMRAVLRNAAHYSDAHPDEKLVIVGHTDLDDQPLSERRARSVFAFLTFGRAPAAALSEWNELRKPAKGGQPSLREGWSTREIRFILQDLGYYSAGIDGAHDPETDAAVLMFQTDKKLKPGDGVVPGKTWRALIKAYLGQDALAVPESRFLPNCQGQILKWLGYGEQDPVRTTAGACRPNRRVELLFVRATALPCQVPKPDTFNLPKAGAVARRWCLGPGDPDDQNCFLARGMAVPGRWLVQPAEPGTVTVRGSIRFEDDTPAANTPYVLIAPDGECMNGEVITGPSSGRPVPGRTADDGTFFYPNRPKGVGVFTLEVQGSPFLVRRAGAPPEAAKGNVVCEHLEGNETFDVVVVHRPEDPSQTGSFSVGEDDYDLGTEDLPLSSGGQMIQVGLRALIRYPAERSGRRTQVANRRASYPLVVIAHGNFPNQPGVAQVPSFQGFEYLARHLASHGYIAISIDLDDVGRGDAGILHRGETVLRHIEIMKARNDNDPRLRGKIDRDRIALVGHSRGGEGVVKAQDINVHKPDGRHDIRAIFSIAPTDSVGLAHSTTPLLVAVGSADKDAGPDDSANLYERAAPLKSMLFIYGGIHNFFNTHPEWVRPGGTKFGEYNIARRDKRVISAEAHLDVARGFATAFFEMVLRGRNVYLPYFNRYLRPASLASVSIHHQFQAPKPFNVDDFEQEPHYIPRLDRKEEPLNSLGLPIERDALDNYEEWSLPWRNTHSGFLRWSNSRGEYRSPLPAADQDVTGFRVLSLRVTLQFYEEEKLDKSPNPRNRPQDFFATLIDRQGRRASVQVGSITSIPYTYIDYKDLRRGVFGRESKGNEIFKTIRIPLARFRDHNPNLDLTAVQAVALEFRQTRKGSIAIDNLEFSN